MLGDLLKRVVGRRRASVETLLAEGLAHMKAGQWPEAAACFESARRSAPQDERVLHNLGLCHANAGNLDEAAACFEAVVRLAPDSASALVNLGNVEMVRRNAEAALDRYGAAVALGVADPGLFNNLGMAYRATARIDDALSAFRKALAIDPRFRDAHENLLFCIQLSSEHGPEAIFAEHRRWAERHAEPLRAAAPDPPIDREPGRPLRVGYVSPDFRRHAVAKFIEPVLAHHDRDAFRIHCYHNTVVSDDVTARLRPLAHVWRDVAALDDAALAARIRDDRIDILVDLAGHTTGGRLLCFARKPAPVQITYLGYSNTTGMAAMDYRLTDGVADPVGEAERYHSEQLLRLPHAQWCFRPDDEVLPVNDLPARSAGHATFGSFNNAWKINPAVIAAWSRILVRTPGSRLVMVGLPGEATRARFAGLFAGHGVEASRLDLRARVSDAEFWQLRQRIDVALDPFPYNGVTSTCEALWSGTPMPALLGVYGQSRCAGSLLTAVGLPELVAGSEDEYVGIGVRLASDLEALARLRASLRERMRRSPLMDYAGFAREVEGLYRGVWERFGRREGPK